MASPAKRLIFAVVAPVQRFFRLEAAGGIVLVVAAAIALGLANSPLGSRYVSLVHTPLRVAAGTHEITMTVHALVNDVLMTVFFVVAGMEIKREIATGELRTLRRAALPLIAAAGGMLFPALIYLALNRGAEARNGWAIPTATDIAFALGCLSVVRRRIPWSLFVFLTALAIFDDLGAILIIAVAYGNAANFTLLFAAAALSALLFGLARARVQQPWAYLLVGAALWFAVAGAGLHPTLAGVIVGLSIPTKGKRSVDETLEDLDVAIESLRQMPANRAEGSLSAMERHLEAMQPPVERLLHGLHAPVAFGIVPIFALVNAGIVLGGEGLVSSVTLGVAAALVLGKGLGVLGGVFLTVRLGIAPLPTGARWAQVGGVALLAGIGFTMSIFVTDLAFPGNVEFAMSAKVGILSGSFASAVLGLLLLRFSSPVASEADDDVGLYHVDLPRFAEGYRVASWAPSTPYAGKTLEAVALRRERGITVLGVFRDQEMATPDGTPIRKLEAVGPQYELTVGETLLIVGAHDDVDRFLAPTS